MMNLSDMNDRQILIHLVHKVYGLDDKIKTVDKKLSNHLVHTFRLTLVLVGVVGSLVVGLILALLG